MDGVSKRRFNALCLFANNKRTDLREINPDIYERRVPPAVERDLIELGFIDFEANTNFIITEDGLQEYRILDKINRNEWIMRISIATILKAILGI